MLRSTQKFGVYFLLLWITSGFCVDVTAFARNPSDSKDSRCGGIFRDTAVSDQSIIDLAPNSYLLQGLLRSMARNHMTPPPVLKGLFRLSADPQNRVDELTPTVFKENDLPETCDAFLKMGFYDGKLDGFGVICGRTPEIPASIDATKLPIKLWIAPYISGDVTVLEDRVSHELAHIHFNSFMHHHFQTLASRGLLPSWAIKRFTFQGVQVFTIDPALLTYLDERYAFSVEHRLVVNRLGKGQGVVNHPVFGDLRNTDPLYVRRKIIRHIRSYYPITANSRLEPLDSISLSEALLQGNEPP